MRLRLVSLLLVVGLGVPTAAQLENVGNLTFPTSASPEAQRHFLRAVAILHSFGWKQAIAEFKLAQKAEPDFALAYWGETLCYNHPLTGEQDAKNPREILRDSDRTRPRAWPRRRRRVKKDSSRPSRHSGATASGARAGSRTWKPWSVSTSNFPMTTK